MRRGHKGIEGQSSATLISTILDETSGILRTEIVDRFNTGRKHDWDRQSSDIRMSRWAVQDREGYLVKNDHPPGHC